MFRSLYRHGFARVAACTTRMHPGRSGGQRGRRSCAWRENCDARRRGARGVSRNSVSGYAIERPAAAGRRCSTRSSRRSPTLIARSAELLPLLVVGAPLRHARARCTTARWRSIAAGCWAWCRRCTCRTIASSTSRAISRPATARPAVTSPSPAIARRSAPTCCSRAEDLPGLSCTPEICEDVWVPIPPSGEAALAGATVLANLSASNITIGKAETRRLLCAVAVGALPGGVSVRRGGGGGIDHRPGLGRPGLDLRERRDAGRDRALPGRRRSTRSPTSTSTCCAQERLRMGRFDDNRRPHTRARRSASRRSAWIRRAAISGCRRRSSAFRSCPPIRDAARAGLLRGLQHPGHRPDRSGCAPPGSSGW